MSTLHLFNPSHDEALADGRAQYFPSHAARRLGAAWSTLPLRWMAEGDVLLQLPEDLNLHRVVRPDWSKIGRIEPWGWDAQIVELLRRLGAPEALLPTAERLSALRRWSSRHTTVRLIEALAMHELPPGVCRPKSRWCTTKAEVYAALAGYGRAMVKSPWSSSGRGVFPLDAGTMRPQDEQRIDRILTRQGAVEVQERCVGLLDAAVEYVAEADGALRFVGLSLFTTSARGGYEAQTVAPQAELEQQLCTAWQSACPEVLPGPEAAHRSLVQLTRLLAALLRPLLADDGAGQPYTGPLGIDLLLTPAGLHPCIEVNLRRTMGHAALYPPSPYETTAASP